MSERPSEQDESDESEPVLRRGTVALLGRSNVGKSTLLNAALELPLAIVSRTPQTTREELLGVVRHAGAEIGLLDTPGLHKATSKLGQAMNRAARQAAVSADALVFVGCVHPRPRPEAMRPHPGDARLLEQLPADKPVVLVINKIDLLRDKALLLPLIAAYAELRSFHAVVPISALKAEGIHRVLAEVAPLLPEGPPRHEADVITDKATRFFVAEYVREPILEATREEVPHACAVSIDEYVEPLAAGDPLRITATVHVEREGQKGILIGAGGATLKRIGTTARARIEELTGQHVYLQLWVRVSPGWRDRPDRWADLGLLQPPTLPEKP